MFFIEHGNGCVCFPELDSLYRKVYQKTPVHAVYVDRENNDTVCVVVHDTDIYLSQYFPSYSFSPLFPTRENQGQGLNKLS